MSTPNLPAAHAQELRLQQLLSHHQPHYADDQGQVSLSVSVPGDDLDLAVLIDWHGVQARLLCRRQQLAQWLAPQLQAADFASLPSALQLAVLQRDTPRLPGLQCLGIEPADAIDRTPGLQVTLRNAQGLLPCWVQGDSEHLLAALPRRPLRERLNIQLNLSLQWRPLEVTLHDLRDLGTGDILLLPAGTPSSPRLLGVLEGHPWAELQLDDTHLELVRMHDTPTVTDTTLEALEQLPIPVSFEVGRQTLDLHTLSALQPGALIELHSPLDAQVRILANQCCIGTGLLVQIDGRLGVRVDRLLEQQPT
ncbi:type III secretion system protein [Pseudomonas sp. 250J]|uniref:type III secretion system cytoplasmic ring protein SctQ n=1 Tax=Pseudomonas TaxID=286 RepID=UPI000682C37A|nr:MULTISPECIES: type III secretion system cytoplasmic ring protein SctQ [Pseudomonas]KNX78713.1 type III secretion system protein [Pseudomonas sp. 250J]MCU7282965.1 type III secretion system cytoplasmic ring protein SctQ [Pseudomonas peradeniyensis]QZA56249.1 type III secretion system cytoplasmic ring protein SctQ [Pseudomonas sp. 2hn]